ncbi:MAG: hypothetical protein POG74_12475 [Acidocella sp.]|nr:hypothetical protein [Acidocella sp.]
MKAVIAAGVAAILLFFGVPMMSGGTVNVCQAYAAHSVNQAASQIAGGNNGLIHDAISSLGKSTTSGDVATQMMAQQHPNVPAPVSCAYYYWKAVL